MAAALSAPATTHRLSPGSPWLLLSRGASSSAPHGRRPPPAPDGGHARRRRPLLERRGAGVVRPSLRVMGLTPHGHHRLRAASKTHPGLFHDVLVSRDGTRVSCVCAACAFHPLATNGRLTVRRRDVLARRVPRSCWHLRHGAKVAPLLVSGYVGSSSSARRDSPLEDLTALSS